MPGFAARGALAPLQSQIDADSSLDYPDFFPVIQDALSFKGQPHALAYDLGPPLLYYNRDLFEAAKVPAPSSTEPMSWEEFRELATRLTDTGQRQYGYAQDCAVRLDHPVDLVQRRRLHERGREQEHARHARRPWRACSS